MPMISVNPATGKRIAVFPNHSAEAVERRVLRAAKAHRHWRAIATEDRAKALAVLATALRARAGALAALATDEMGKPIAQARAEVEKCATLCDYYARAGAAFLAPQRAAGVRHARVVFEPLGPILAIMPWNFPYWQVFRAVVPALFAGNTVLLKHAPNVPGCAQALENVFTRAGFPPGVFQSLFIETAAVAPLIADARIAGVTLTGSTTAGRRVGAMAGAALKPVVLELGGSDPFLVLEDANVAQAAKLAAESRLLNSGQSCICAKRFVVVRRHAGDFVDALTAEFAARRVGDPTQETNDIGPLARADLRERLAAQVRASVTAGARVAFQSQVAESAGFFFPPTILTAVRPGMPAAEEEIFGPVAAVMTVRDEAAAVRAANASDYGLGATVCTREAEAADRVAEQLEVGCVFVNALVRSMPELPFGGVKQSGLGRELGHWGAQAFTNVKTIVGAARARS